MSRESYLKDLEKGTSNLKQKVLRTLAKSPYPLTADEIAAQLGKHYLSIRPRLSELKAAGEAMSLNIEEDRGKSTHGRTQRLWCLTMKGETYAVHP